MKQLPNPDPKSAMIRVKLDPDEMTRLLKPIFEEVNAQRRRIEELELTVDRLEEESASQLLALAEFEARHRDDGR